MDLTRLRLRNSWFAGAFLVLTSVTSDAIEQTRLVALRLPPDAVAEVRAELLDPLKTSKSETMEQVLKRQGVVLVAELQVENPWREEIIELEKTTGAVEGADERLDLGLFASIRSFRDSGNIDMGLCVEVRLPRGAKKARTLYAIGDDWMIEPGTWREWFFWSDGKEAVMLWEYPQGFPEAPASQVGDASRLQLETRWFQLEDSDLAQLAKSKPETRENAMKWLEKRTPLRKEMLCTWKHNSKSGWSEKLGNYSEKPILEEGLTIHINGFREDGAVKVDLTLAVLEQGKESKSELSANLVPGVWEFLPVAGMPGANIVACRVIHPKQK
jgi:hypothetical protein